MPMRRQIHRPDLNQPIMELFRLGSHRDKPNLNRHQMKLDPNQHHLQLCAVCLAACKYQHRKWCHSGDTVNPVWTPASRWKLDPKWLLVVTVYTVCVLDLQAQLSVTFLLLLSDQSGDKHPSERLINQNQDRITLLVSASTHRHRRKLASLWSNTNGLHDNTDVHTEAESESVVSMC